jgi:hypothetical protein
MFCAVCFSEDEIYAAGVDVVENVVEGGVVDVVFYVVHGDGEVAVRGGWGRGGWAGGRMGFFGEGFC